MNKLKTNIVNQSPDIIETQLKNKYGIRETEFKALSGALGLKHIYELPTETRCIEIAEKIINDNFVFKPTGVNVH